MLSNKQTKMRVLMMRPQCCTVATWKRTTHSQHEVLFTQTTGLLGGPAGPAHLHTSAAPQAVTVHDLDKASMVQVQTVEISDVQTNI